MKIKVYKTQIKPTKEQQILLSKSYGIARYCYNWSLNYCMEYYKEHGKGVSGYEVRKEFNNSSANAEWVSEVPGRVKANAILNLSKAYTNFFQGRAKHPKFKSKKTSKKSFTLDGSFVVRRNAIRVPKIGWLSFKEFGYVPVGSDVSQVTISEVTGKTYISVMVKNVVNDPSVNSDPSEGIGIDLGIKDMAILNDGTSYGNVNKTARLRKLKKKHARDQRALSRKYVRGADKQSNNYMKQKMKVARNYDRLTRIRKEYQRQVVSDIVKRKPSFITIEDLNISGMLKNRHLSKSIYEARLYEFVSWLQYQCRMNGIELRQVSRWFPSTKLCSGCGSLKDMPLKERTYVCDCGVKLDRDINAAINLKNAVDYTILT